MKLGDLIKDLRLNKEFSQQEVADKVGISRSVLSQYENNIVEPTAYVVKKFAIFFDVTSDYLLGIEDDFGARATMSQSDVERYSEEEKDLIKKYRSLDKRIKKIIRDQLEVYSEPEELLPKKDNKV